MNWNRSTPQEMPETGSHIARCIGLIDLGTQQHSFGGEVWSSRDVRLTFEMPGQIMTGEYNPELKGRPFGASITLKQSLHPSAKMRKLLKSWRGRDFTKEELSAFDPKKLIGAPCRLTLIASQDGQYVNIDSIAPLGKGEKCPKQINASTYFSLDPGEFDVKVLSNLSEKTREKITASPEYKALFDDSHSAQPDADDSHGGEDPDDDNPF